MTKKTSTLFLFLPLAFCFFTDAMQWQQKQLGNSYTLLFNEKVTDTHGYITQQKKLFFLIDTAKRLTLNEITFCSNYNIRNLWIQKNDCAWTYSKTLCTPIGNVQLIPALEVKCHINPAHVNYFVSALFLQTVSQVNATKQAISKKQPDAVISSVTTIPPSKSTTSEEEPQGNITIFEFLREMNTKNK